jgi:hypothetical protein
MGHMPELVCELIVSLDGFARGQRSPGYFGYFGPDFDDWIKTNTAMPLSPFLRAAGHGLRPALDQGSG